MMRFILLLLGLLSFLGSVALAHTDIGQQLQLLGGVVKTDNKPLPEINARPKRWTDVGQQLQLLGGVVKTGKKPLPEINVRPRRMLFE